MNKKIISLSILTAVIILLTGCTPALASPKNNLLAVKNDLVTIEVNQYPGRQPKQIYSTVTTGEAEEIRHNLIELYNAQERNDRHLFTNEWEDFAGKNKPTTLFHQYGW
ncbi:MAG: hypothetical protein NTX92_06070 [Euryarchaeota archaeon]|nr:hypothetical protein [Euryarchaeota archaeon]